MISAGVVKRVFENGLTLLVREDHTCASVAIFTYVKAGYLNESDREVGISHVIEHMFFKGTRRRPVGRIAKETKALGGYLNASTIYDHTLYYTVLPASGFVQGLDIQADALFNPAFDPDELRKEIEVIIQEAKRKLDNPTAVAREKMFGLAFERHRMRRWRIGSEEGLRRLTRDDVVRFHKTYYGPENIILAVTGDVISDVVLREVEKRYAHVPRSQADKESSPQEPPQTAFKFDRLTGDIQHSHVSIGFHTPPAFHPDSYALEVLAFVLGQGRSSRLYRNVQQRRNLVTTVSAANYELKDVGLFFIEASGPAHKMEEAEAEIFQQIRQVQTHAVEEVELEKARNALQAGYLYSLEAPSGQASILARYEALGGYQLAETYLSRLARVTADDLVRVARTYLHARNCSVFEYVPRTWSGARESSDHRERLRSLLDLETPGGLAGFSEARVESPPPPAQHSEPGETPIVAYGLSGGGRLLVKENHKLPIVSIGVFFPGGRADETEDLAGLTALTLRTSLRGTRNRTAEEISAQAEGLGSSIRFSSEPDYFSYSMNLLAEHFETGLDILADVILHPTFPEEGFRKEQESLLNFLEQERDDMYRYPLKLLFERLFAGHAYGLPANGRAEVIQACDRNSLVTWHRQLLGAPTVVVVGAAEHQRLRDLIEHYFGTLGPARPVPPPNVNLPPPGTLAPNVEMREKEQTAIGLGFRGPHFADDDYYALTVLQNAISGLGGRFFEELRGRRSLAYTVHAYLVSRRMGGAFVGYIATSPENEQDALEGLLGEFDRLTRAPLSAEELRQAVQYTVGAHQIGLEANRAKLFHYAHWHLLGRSLAEAEEFDRRVQKVTAEEIQQAAKKYFDPERYALGVVRGRRD